MRFNTVKFETLDDLDFFLEAYFSGRECIGENVYEVSPSGWIIVSGKTVAFLMSDKLGDTFKEGEEA
tara:strand:- start:2328 stop:2528 length:201 start_codon:yes stop_codon:yes gene_type:complete